MDNENKKSINAEREERILAFWKENEIFNKSLKKESPRGKYVFYDGPPFATGLPHYGHILGSTVKDVIGRYKTMRGFHVPRRWGWDCHGLPIENIVEKELGISGKKAIEEYGINKFTEFARSKVLTYVSEWKKTVDRIGRWVDFDNSYKTMDNSFIESVWWALGEMNKKELLYEGVRVLAYCPRCETPIANSEIAMDNSYKDITDISVYVKFLLEGETNVYVLAWTTTPWSLPGNTAIAINKNIKYVKVEYSGEFYILAKDRIKFVPTLKDIEFKDGENMWDIDASLLLGKKYTPPFDYYKNIDMPNKENIWKIWDADFVTIDAGTGIAHEAPAFGEDDMNLAKKEDIPFILHVDNNGSFSKEATDFVGIKVKPKEDHQSGDVLIIKYLAQKGLLFAKEKIVHSYPHCYRCETPLLYYALPSWFVNIKKVKSELLEKAKGMNWIPEHLKEGRFKNTMEGAPDWTISRNRYWASPLPFWKSESGKIMFVNSIEDLKSKTKKSGNKYFIMRHGEAENNVSELTYKYDSHGAKLTEKGKEQVLESSKSLKEKIDIVISSPFERARETTKIICEQIGFPLDKVVYDERIQEWEISSIFEGKDRSIFKKYYDEDYVNKPTEILPDGESFAQLIKRVGDFIYEVENNYANKNILMVGHAGADRALSFIANGLSFGDLQTRNKELTSLKNAEICKFNFIPLPHNDKYELDLHRPYIDEIVLVDEKGEEYKRVPEVIDCWFESGSMPFAQDHYPFENKNWQKENFPAGFVAEYIAQTRTWFYYTHAISTILFESAPFENIVTTGTVLAEDGSKMSKSKNNYPDPWILFNKYGVDALRFYLMSSTLMKGEDVNFSEKAVNDISSKIVGRLDNVVAFYELYRDKELESNEKIISENVLDKWILARLEEIISESSSWMEKYDVALATKPMDLFVDDLSTWYLRRSRDRIKNESSEPASAQGYGEARKTLYFVLKTLSKLVAPFTPFVSDDIWQKLKLSEDIESVHLVSWPSSAEDGNEKTSEIITIMQKVRNIVTLGLEARQKAGIKVRQPLSSLAVKGFDLGDEYIEILKDELNVKNIISDNTIANEVELDTNITPDLHKEGQYRELVRAIQDLRKSEKLNPSDVVTLAVETNSEGQELINKFKNELLKVVSAKEIKLESVDGAEVKIGELTFKIKILQ